MFCLVYLPVQSEEDSPSTARVGHLGQKDLAGFLFLLPTSALITFNSLSGEAEVRIGLAGWQVPGGILGREYVQPQLHRHTGKGTGGTLPLGLGKNESCHPKIASPALGSSVGDVGWAGGPGEGREARA